MSPIAPGPDDASAGTPPADAPAPDGHPVNAQGAAPPRVEAQAGEPDARAPSLDLAEILDILPPATLVVDGVNRIRFANDAAERLLERSQRRLARCRLEDIVGRSGALVGLAARARVSGGGVIGEADMTLPSRDDVRMSAQAVAVDGAPGHVAICITQWAFGTRDDRRREVQGAALSARGLAAMLAHEIKNPLSGVRGAAQLLEASAHGETAGLPELIIAEVDRIRALVDELETFTNPAFAEAGPENIHALLNHVLDLARAGVAADVAIQTRFDPSLPPVLGQRDRLIQVFLNLIKNAAEAAGAHAGGDARITLTTAYRPGYAIRPRQGELAGRRALALEITVADNGPGVPEHLIDHIFDPFVSDKAQGGGLGLAVAAKYVADHDGLIECRNTETGALFRVLLPSAPLDPAAPSDKDQAP
ncbi:nitrogen specific signal transduction histidine kinase NtrB [Rhodothalassium salexigens DSM 2132]|uniref:histidine kinase n=1 Tax=Rhodothalassium salexigens DSM 2132 TaxID=1188247 RepID=A0A4R2PR58_RHOSA|nr:ATP-binding protein [Rhodothalassium salexigens]MBB4210146.1 two-component system nitrogen regulation sensor histidine kinase GlnL [Rhodothalassium salexigens DSM 2132]MBK1640122.1 hypothetical protein [Rhodothalassium salexigens DSM 2132]TCP38310.1 nitrogen specific signal transduction histidine kinase NtrB [Rhodothalassium salexigens DSM 2132]